MKKRIISLLLAAAMTFSLVYAEMYGAKFGMGFYVKKFAEYGLYSEAWSGFIFMVVVLVIVMQIFEKMKNRILRWTIN